MVCISLVLALPLVWCSRVFFGCVLVCTPTPTPRVNAGERAYDTCSCSCSCTCLCLCLSACWHVCSCSCSCLCSGSGSGPSSCAFSCSYLSSFLCWGLCYSACKRFSPGVHSRSFAILSKAGIIMPKPAASRSTVRCWVALSAAPTPHRARLRHVESSCQPTFFTNSRWIGHRLHTIHLVPSFPFSLLSCPLLSSLLSLALVDI